MYVIGTVLASIIGYLIGSFSFSIMIVKLKTKEDIRNFGSKNAGATNASRKLGKKWGILIMLLDASKVFITAFVALIFTYIPNEAFQYTSFYIPGFFALIGHCFPIYYKFKGGKAVSCFLGLTALINWAICLIFFFVWVILILTFRIVSVSSIFSSLFALVAIWIPVFSGVNSMELNNDQWLKGMSFFEPLWGTFKGKLVWMNSLHTHGSRINYAESFLEICIIITLSSFILIFRHKDNIIKLINKKETTLFSFKKQKATS
ncbi:glycerol-3-phosphate 1-O-acyltransferase PlsY [Spiroplasma tabanidicola]|uniref:Glycerol-3-phosphate acyltransferase n=1 Tax=Spiroplasma tabanidicola TaxID=324079 RepID=A0A6I6CD81_9MOLU|nr:glycerol-3-phosphate 1-O-acyltransferase PlsY [Spiroplasma tabanidicola]QGS51934.1 glycerol-3-phosphate acyltransferase PlsY [Spiroplasma tabanidicola]